MGHTVRVIPRLDIKGPNLVKGIHLEGLRVLGTPDVFAREYYEAGADELLYMDVVASLYERNSLVHFIEKAAREIFIPMTVGGGLRTIDDIRTVLRAGADKVSLNTAALRRPDFIREASRRFGSSTIVVSIETIRQPDGSYHCYTDNGREGTGVDAFAWAVQAVELGAGELLVTSVDREGTGTGYDVPLTRRIAEAVDIPVIACGGAGSAAHVADVISEGRASAVSMASILHYELIRRLKTHAAPSEGNTRYLQSGRTFTGRTGSGLEPTSLQALKAHLAANDISCRPAAAGSGAHP